MDEKVRSLIDKAEKTASADEALKFSQAALNAANALRVSVDTKALSK